MATLHDNYLAKVMGKARVAPAPAPSLQAPATSSAGTYPRAATSSRGPANVQGHQQRPGSSSMATTPAGGQPPNLSARALAMQKLCANRQGRLSCAAVSTPTSASTPMYELGGLQPAPIGRSAAFTPAGQMFAPMGGLSHGTPSVMGAARPMGINPANQLQRIREEAAPTPQPAGQQVGYIPGGMGQWSEGIGFDDTPAGTVRQAKARRLNQEAPAAATGAAMSAEEDSSSSEEAAAQPRSSSRINFGKSPISEDFVQPPRRR